MATRRRDEAESIRHAVRRICLPKGLDPYGITEFAALETVLILLDNSMAAVMSRADVVRLLGNRAAMQPTWADRFRDEVDNGDEDGAPSEERWPESIRQTVPPDEVVTRYVTRGALSRYVEGVAATNEVFAGDLAACIDALLEAREDVGLVARRWRKRARVAAVADPLRFAAVPATRLAAASGPESELAKTELRLGALSPTDAVLRIVVTSRGVTMHITTGEKPIERIQLGEAVATSPIEVGYWELLLSPLPESAVTLRVLATDGTEFAEELRFAPVDASHETH